MSKKEPKYRYPGSYSYNSEDETTFFGRDEDFIVAKNLINSRNMVVLYGKSGDGKSSFVKAKLIPNLNRLNKSIDIKYFEFNNFESNNQQSPNELIINALKEGVDIWAPFDKLIPNENSFWYWLKLRQKSLGNSSNKFILFFDQFESIFTFPADIITKFSENLSHLGSNNIPIQYREKLYDEDQIDSVSDEILDFLNLPLQVTIVFVVREDKLSLLPLLRDRNPDILQNLFFLKAIDEKSAEKVIIESARPNNEINLTIQEQVFHSNEFEYSRDVLNKIIQVSKKGNNELINTHTLQIICREIENKVISEEFDYFIEETNKNVDRKVFKIEFSNLNEIEHLAEEFYNKTISTVCREYGLIENELKDIIEQKFIINDNRVPANEDVLIYEKPDEEKEKYKNILNALVEKSLLRKDKDFQNRTFYELGHDALIDFLKVEKEKREQQKKIEKEYNEFRKKIEEEERELQIKREGTNKLKKVFLIATLIVFVLGIIVYLQYNENTRIEKKNRRIDSTLSLTGDSLRVKEDLISLKDSIRKEDSLRIYNANNDLKNEIIARYNNDLNMVESLMKPPLLDFKRAYEILNVLKKRRDTIKVIEPHKNIINMLRSTCKIMIPMQEKWEIANGLFMRNLFCESEEYYSELFHEQKKHSNKIFFDVTSKKQQVDTLKKIFISTYKIKKLNLSNIDSIKYQSEINLLRNKISQLENCNYEYSFK